MPYVHGSKVRSIRVVITDAINNSDLALIVQSLEWCHTRIKPKCAIYRQNSVLFDVNSLSKIIIILVPIRNDSIQVVIASRQL